MKDEFDELETCGMAFGFAIAAALRSKHDFSNNAGLLAFAENLQQLTDDESFPPDACLVLNSTVQGLRAFAKAAADTGRPVG